MSNVGTLSNVVKMTCDRCEDIHKAQRDGKTSNECKCSCHTLTTITTQPWHWETQPFYYQPQMPSTGDPPWKQGETTCRDLFWRVNTGLNTGDI